MSKNIVTVPTTCPCGAAFQREVRRGRPQVWCAPCMAIPFANRKVSLVAEGDVTEPERPVNQWDPHDAVRAQIEVNVAEVYADWKTNGTSAKMRAAGSSEFEISDAQRVALTAAYKAAGVA